MMKLVRLINLTLLSVFLTGCTTTLPRHPDNLCAIFKEQHHWYQAAKKARKKWGVPVHVPLAIMYQESAFKAKAAPPMRYFLGFIPYGRASSAYGYAQVKTLTWDDYRRETEHSWSSRANFADSIDFIGWYMNKSNRLNGTSKWDPYNQYLNYHEGWGGFRQQSYQHKKWLLRIAHKVEQRAQRYAQQYQHCQKNLDTSWLWRLFFG